MSTCIFNLKNVTFFSLACTLFAIASLPAIEGSDLEMRRRHHHHSSSESDHCRCICPAGPQGPKGDVGPQGPAGALAASFASSYSLRSDAAIPILTTPTDIFFASEFFAPVGINHVTNTATYQVTKSGYYAVSWTLSAANVTSTARTLTIQLEIDALPAQVLATFDLDGLSTGDQVANSGLVRILLSQGQTVRLQAVASANSAIVLQERTFSISQFSPFPAPTP